VIFPTPTWEDFLMLAFEEIRLYGYGIRAGEIASLLAVHFERGGEKLQAVHYWQQAGENPGRPSAYHEAIATLRKALALLAMLADSPERTQPRARIAAHPGGAADGRAGHGICRRGRSLHPGARTLPTGGGGAAALPSAVGPFCVS
jgi:hypothetical protein